MKKILINYYAVIMTIMFIIHNVVPTNINIDGILYTITMILFIILNIIILIKYQNKIKFKALVIIILFLILLASKDVYHLIFNITSIITLIITGVENNKFIIIITIIISSIFMIFYLNFLLFILIICASTNDIYEDTHYYCQKNYEIYSYSAGAMDKFHYSIGKHYELININGIITISYSERNEKTEKEYNTFLKNHKCVLVGEKYESK